MLPYWVIWIGFVLNLIGGASYIIDTVKGKIKPNRVTFLIWPIAPLIIFFAQIEQGVKFEALFSLLVATMPLLVFVASFLNKKSVWKLTHFDIACGILSVVGLILWQITQQGNIAIALSIISDGLATLPTIVKSYNHPETEAAMPWFLGVLYALLNLLTIKQWDFATSGFAIYIFVAMVMIFVFTFTKIGKRKIRFARV